MMMLNCNWNNINEDCSTHVKYLVYMLANNMAERQCMDQSICNKSQNLIQKLHFFRIEGIGQSHL